MRVIMQKRVVSNEIICDNKSCELGSLMKIPIIISTCLILVAIANSETQSGKKRISDAILENFELLDRELTAKNEAGKVPEFDVKRARLLLNRAHFLHGDISRSEFLIKSDQIGTDLIVDASARFYAGTVSSSYVVEVNGDILLDAAIANGEL